MSEPAIGWRRSSLGEIARVRRGASPRPISDPKWFAGEGPGWVRIADVSRAGRYLRKTEQRLSRLGLEKSVRVGPGDIIMSIAGTIGKPAIVDMDACIHDGFVLFSELDSEVDREFLFYFLGWKAGEFDSRGQPGTQKNINTTIVGDTPIDLPPPYEQRKIAAVLSSIDSADEESRKIIEHLSSFRKALASHLLSHGLDHGVVPQQPTPFGTVPKRWRTRKLGDVTEQVRDEVRVEPTGTYREIGIRSHGKGIFHKEPTSGGSLGNKKVFWVEPGCLILNIVFAWEGAVASSSSEEAGFIASHRFPMFKPDPKELDLEFLRVLFQTKRGVEVLGSHSPGGAGRNRTLNQTSLRNTEIPLPPLEEQRRISLTLLSVEARLKSEVAALQGLNEIKGGLSAGLMSGAIRVKPDEVVA